MILQLISSKASRTCTRMWTLSTSFGFSIVQRGYQIINAGFLGEFAIAFNVIKYIYAYKHTGNLAHYTIFYAKFQIGLGKSILRSTEQGC